MRFLTPSLLTLLALSHGFKLQSRIINGNLSNPKDYPFYVSLASDSGLCGGSLISDRYLPYFKRKITRFIFESKNWVDLI